MRGRVHVLDETLVAPLSGRACVAYHARVRTDTAGLQSAETLQIRPFAIDREDGAGRSVVDGEQAGASSTASERSSASHHGGGREIPCANVRSSCAMPCTRGF